MLSRWRTLWRRRRAYGRAAQCLKDFWQAGRGANTTDYDGFIVIDCEMTGLDVVKDELLSIGWVRLGPHGVEMQSAKHRLIKSDAQVGQSATIHMIRDCELQQGLSIDDVLLELLADAKGFLPVFHNASLDLAFLNQSVHHAFGAPWWPSYVDTLLNEKRLLERHSELPKSGALTLAQCRVRYNLPAYRGHNALVDALATAELLLAEIKKGVTIAPLW